MFLAIWGIWPNPLRSTNRHRGMTLKTVTTATIHTRPRNMKPPFYTRTSTKSKG